MPKLDMGQLVLLIKRKHETQAEFCNQFDISRSTMHKWKAKNGEINEQLMVALCKHFDVNRIELDQNARHIDEQILSECAAKVQKVCDELSVDFVDMDDRVYWTVTLYRQRVAQQAYDDTALRKALSTNVIRIEQGEEK